MRNRLTQTILQSEYNSNYNSVAVKFGIYQGSVMVDFCWAVMVKNGDTT